jgi:hypothetical protein
MKFFYKIGTITLALVLALVSLHAQTVDEVIDKYINALGGKQKLKALRSIKIVGELHNQGMVMGITTSIINGVGLRTDITVPDLGSGFQILTPTKGWSLMSFSGPAKPQPLSAEQVTAGQPSIDLQGALLNYKQKGNQVELAGKEMVDSLNCYKLKITFKSGDIKYYFIDDQQFRRVKLLATEIVNGVPTELETLYSDFRRTPQGYLFPYVQTNKKGTMHVKLVTINPAIKTSIFQPK